MEEQNSISKDESKLHKLVKEYGKNWAKISAKMKKYTPEECAKMYRTKFDKIKNKRPWTVEEDQTILTLYTEYGAQWNNFVSFFSDRSSCDIKNRYYRFVRKQNPGFQQQIKSQSEDSEKEDGSAKVKIEQEASTKPFMFRVEDLLN